MALTEVMGRRSVGALSCVLLALLAAAFVPLPRALAAVCGASSCTEKIYSGGVNVWNRRASGDAPYFGWVEGNLNGTALVLQFDEYGVVTRDTGFVTFAPYSKDGQGLSPVYGGYSNRIINPYLYLSNGADPMQLLYQASEGNCWYGACIKTYEEGDAVLQIIQPRKSLASPPRPLLMNIDTHQFLSVDFFCYDKELKGLKLHQVKIDPIDFTFKNPKENYIVLPDDCVNVGSTYPLVINNLSMGKKKEGGARASTIVVKKKMELENAEMGNVPIITA